MTGSSLDCDQHNARVRRLVRLGVLPVGARVGVEDEIALGSGRRCAEEKTSVFASMFRCDVQFGIRCIGLLHNGASLLG